MNKNYFEIIRPGINTTFQDQGRKKLYHIGIPFSGAMDNRNYLLANKLVGNGLDHPVVEFAYQGPLLKYYGDNINIAITGDINFMIKRNNNNIKIFGNQPWTGVNQYCGYIQDNKVKDLFRSAKICPNLSEPHAHEYGFDINERCFKILCAGGFCISDNITSIRNIFDDNGVVFAESPDDFASKIDYYLENEDERVAISQKGREFVLNNHTNFHRISHILQHFGYQKEATDIVSGWQNAKEYINE